MNLNSNTKTKLTNTINKILDEGRIPPGQQTQITHVSMGGNKGKFCLNKVLRKKLVKSLAEATELGMDYHIAEMPKEYGPIIFDIDLDMKKADYKKDRLYDDDMIVEVVQYYRTAINKYLNVSKEQLKVCIFEKEAPTTKETTIRDGFHGFFHQICTSDKIRHLIRNEVVALAEESATFTEGFLKSVPEIFDKSIVSTNAWLMYGCKKNDGKPYILTKVLDSDFQDFGPDSLGDQLQKTKIFSIQQKMWKVDNATAYSENYNEEKVTKEYNDLGVRGSKTVTNNNEVIPENKQVEIQKAKAYMSMIKESRADAYGDWIRIGWALHNVDKSLLDEWIEFSQKSDKYKEGECEERWYTMKDEGLTLGSIRYWAKEDNPEEYKAYNALEYQACLERSVETNTWFIAKALHNKYCDRFVCVSTKNNCWYEFKNHRWALSESGTALNMLICDDFINDFMQKSSEWNNKAIGANGHEREEFQSKASKMQKIIDRLLNLTFKKQIMEEARSLFFDSKFIQKLDDTNKHLLGFENGVYDLEKEEFRAGRPDDYISLSTKVQYIPWITTKKDVKKYKEKFDKYFSQILTDPEIRNYFLLSLASCCSGENKDQKFRMITGSGSAKNGSNGKSLTMSLFSKAFGDYYSACPITIITRKRNGSNQASPELARLKGVRAGIFQETDANENLNVGMLKELTGNDKQMVRPLYQEPFDLQFQCKFFLQCNKLPVVDAQDEGTWRRLRVIEFSSRFVEKPDPTKPYEFPLDNTLEYAINDWAPYFMSYLTHLYVTEYKNTKILSEPKAVMAFTDSYRNENDSARRFYAECIDRDTTSRLTITINALWERYRDWVKEQADDSLKLLSRADFDKQIIEIVGMPVKNGGWKGLVFKIVNPQAVESDDEGKGNLDI